MGAVKGSENSVTSSHVEEILSGKSTEIGAAREISAAEMQEASTLQSQVNSTSHGGFDHQRYMLDNEKKIAKTEAHLEALLKTSEEKKAQLAELVQTLNEKQAYNQKIIDATEKLKNFEQTPENKRNLEILQGMVALREDLKQQIQLFKVNVQKQKVEWEISKVVNRKNPNPSRKVFPMTTTRWSCPCGKKIPKNWKRRRSMWLPRVEALRSLNARLIVILRDGNYSSIRDNLWRCMTRWR
eukprot:TRINITY_DN525_c0_g1_i4.p1 TRINITY_DN525_c0_g1~~TRINITY_DN525_c0_g1_i4.p1  ORF type:complete len:241 (+),score=43.20 TRINITY_DN525_c0_g1_i4:348-1070(+)